MQIALRIESPSPEATFLKETLGNIGQVHVIGPWGADSHTREYDLAVGVGPVASCPLSRRKLLVVLGPTACHADLDWDMAVVTSRKAQKIASLRFNRVKGVVCCPMPVLALDAGKRRLRDRETIPICASPVKVDDCDQFNLWGSQRKIPQFCAMDFNSRCRHGAYGYYLGLEDGYDVQARRHLALGSPVVCNLDEEVLDDLTSSCVQSINEIPEKQTVIPDWVSEREYQSEILKIARNM